jgi:hypothetical protein
MFFWAVFKLHETYALPAQRGLEPLQNEVLSTFHVQLQEIDCANPFLGEKLVSTHHRAFHPLAGPGTGEINKRRVAARWLIMADWEFAGVRGQPEIKALDAIVLSQTCPERRGRIRYDFERVDGCLGKQPRRHKRPRPVVRSNVKDCTESFATNRGQ